MDEYGDIVLTRGFQDMNGNTKDVRDILPILRGGFTSPEGVVYSNIQSYESLSGFNMSLVEYTTNNKLTLENYKALT